MLEKSEKMSGRDITNFVKKLKEKAKLVSIELGKDDAIDNPLIEEYKIEKIVILIISFLLFIMLF